MLAKEVPPGERELDRSNKIRDVADHAMMMPNRLPPAAALC
jgi:hypothetical protein